MVNTEFVDALASAAPVPGGGGAAAYAGALAAALGSMVGNITAGKPKFADVEPQMRQAVATLGELQAELLQLIDADAKAFSALAACWKMPKATEDEKAARHAAEQAALNGACLVPIDIMHACERIIEIDAFLADSASRLVLSDVGASAIMAQAAIKAASLSVSINTTLMDDKAAAQAHNDECARLLKVADEKAQKIFDYVAEVVS